MFNEPVFSKSTIALGLDLGFGHTKYAFLNEGGIRTGSFPSIAIRSAGTDLASVVEGIGARDADLKVEVSGITYVIDTSESQSVASSVIRTENDNFPSTGEYAALVFACCTLTTTVLVFETTLLYCSTLA
ncbi:hypothetical protein LMG28614_05183 [Paraburkholderia ultramafica]|uniref:Uncharacterized protein n=1 Tax=Paraburkholderia ultramafica TaxID=1544867 RepID=A0A6S7BRY9_9BURK|nr:hypothetical protein [Paraburkholderia ultramafica]CAB3800468.1 hypothetical protein LMG28614_05183 [Paraburkholderia ultramafica]